MAWTSADDRKLAELFRKGAKGGIDHRDTSPEAIKKLIQLHFPGRTYNSTAQLFKRKSAEWILNEDLESARGKRVCGNYLHISIILSLLSNIFFLTNV